MERDGGARAWGERRARRDAPETAGVPRRTPTRGGGEGDGRRCGVFRRTSSSYARRPHAPGAFLACRLMVAPSTPRDPSPGGLGLVERRARARLNSDRRVAGTVTRGPALIDQSGSTTRDFHVSGGEAFLGRSEADASASIELDVGHDPPPPRPLAFVMWVAPRVTTRHPDSPVGNGSSRPPCRARITAPGRETPE